MMRFRFGIIGIFLLTLILANFEVATAEELTVKILEVPMQNVKTDGLPLGSNGKVDLDFYEPYSVEFTGSKALSYGSCEQLVEGIKGLETTWTIAGVENKREISPSSVLYTIALTKSGIQCALSRRERTWWGTDYTFASGEQSVPMTIKISLNGVLLAEKVGMKKNPSFLQPAPIIVGLNRGDTAKGYLEFELQGQIPKGPFLVSPTVELCPVNVTYGPECGWGYIDNSGNGLAIVNPKSVGKSATLFVRWRYENSSGHESLTESKFVGINLEKGSAPIPWEIVRNLNDIEIIPNLNCASSALVPGSRVNCTITPELIFADPVFGGIADTNLRAQVAFKVVSKADNCTQQTSMITAISNQKNPFVVQIPKEARSVYAVSLGLTSDSLKLSKEKLYPGNLPGYIVFGESPTSFGYSAGTGANCHTYTERAARPIAKVPSGKVDKSSNAYKKMLTVGRNFGKVSLAGDTGKSQCTSALQSGLIRANGIPNYLGSQTALIQSYLKTPSGFQGCLDGFGR
jgi:hypothetical protein